MAGPGMDWSLGGAVASDSETPNYSCPKKLWLSALRLLHGCPVCDALEEPRVPLRQHCLVSFLLTSSSCMITFRLLCPTHPLAMLYFFINLILPEFLSPSFLSSLSLIPWTFLSLQDPATEEQPTDPGQWWGAEEIT